MPEADMVPVLVDGRELRLTNLGKVLYPADGFTKGEVLDYYQRVCPVILPHIAGRPMTLRRYPDGVAGQSFFAKRAPAGRPDWLRTEKVIARGSLDRSAREPVRYVVIDDLPALMWAVNLAAIELHVPMWRFPETAGPVQDQAASPASADAVPPDLLVFDLDPGAPATIVECCRVAEALRPALEAQGLRPLPKTSGGKGLQLYVPVSGLTTERARALARAFARLIEGELPGAVVSRMAKSLRTGKVLIDWSQNSGSKTTIAPYSLRAREHPAVSTPVTWDEVADCRHPRDLSFTASDVLTRVQAHGDLFAPLVA